MTLSILEIEEPDDLSRVLMIARCDVSSSAPTRESLNVTVHTALLAERERGGPHERRCARALLRHALSSRAPTVAPEAWQLGAGAHGKPEIIGPAGAPRLRFNVTHTAGLVACVVADRGLVGIDVEALDRRCNFAAVAAQCFTASERRELCALPPAEQRHRFFALWTLKEAYVKARGVGVTLPFATPSFVLEQDAPIRTERDPGCDDDGSAWQFVHLQPGARHLVAVALRSE